MREWGDDGEPGILLWPGLGFTGAYFAGVGPKLPGRCVAVDPPGFGGSPPLETYSYERLVELAVAVLAACRCRAIVGHSLGGDIAVGVCNARPAELRAAVLIDGGYLDDAARIELDSPFRHSREELLRRWRENETHYPDWDTALRDCAAGFGGGLSPELEAALRDVFVEADGEIRPAAPPERVADLIVATRRRDVAALARGVAVPTLLVAAGQPPGQRAAKQRAWEAFAEASPLIDLHVAEDWNHHPFMEVPDRSAALVAAWLRPYL